MGCKLSLTTSQICHTCDENPLMHAKTYLILSCLCERRFHIFLVCLLISPTRKL